MYLRMSKAALPGLAIAAALTGAAPVTGHAQAPQPPADVAQPSITASTAAPADLSPGSAIESGSVPGLPALRSRLDAAVTDVKTKVIDPSLAHTGRHASSLRDGAYETLHNAGDVVVARATPIIETLAAIPGWPRRRLEAFVDALQSGEFGEFSELVNESGFTISYVRVRLGIIPSLSIEFTHMRDLTDQERAVVTQKIKDYTSQVGGAAGYIETTILQSLLQAGEQSEHVKLQTVLINLVPFPSIDLKFNPFEFHAYDLNELVDPAERSPADVEARARALVQDPGNKPDPAPETDTDTAEAPVEAPVEAPDGSENQ